MRALLQERFMPEEAFQLGLFDPGFGNGSLDGYLSKSGLKHLQELLNHPSWAITVEDKNLFYRLCRALGVAAPELYALIYRTLPGWTHDGDTPRGVAEWARYLAERMPSIAVLKPSYGVYGRQVMVLRRRGKSIVDHHEDVVEPRRLVDLVFADRADRGWVLQERLVCHVELASLSGTEALQTFRMITLAGPNGVEILHSHLKIIVGANHVDNNEHGLRGNLQAAVDVSSGVLGPAEILRTDGRGADRYPRHPTTDRFIEGMTVPQWDRLCRFTRDAATQFLPLQTVGWDVALTPQGPRLVEGNAWYDPPPVGQGSTNGHLRRRLQTACGIAI